MPNKKGDIKDLAKMLENPEDLEYYAKFKSLDKFAGEYRELFLATLRTFAKHGKIDFQKLYFEIDELRRKELILLAVDLANMEASKKIWKWE